MFGPGPGPKLFSREGDKETANSKTEVGTMVRTRVGVSNTAMYRFTCQKHLSVQILFFNHANKQNSLLIVVFLTSFILQS